MKFSFTKLATTALTGLAALGFASASFATPTPTTPAEGSLDAHVVLAQAIEAQGIDLVINHPQCQQMPIHGFYSGHERLLVICQDNYKGQGQEEWTANDLDTLRHEAQHMIQDCMDRKIDHQLKPVYRDPIALAFEVLGPDGAKKINEVYRRNGAKTDTVILEWEAFAVAEMNVPLEQSQDIARFCRGN